MKAKWKSVLGSTTSAVALSLLASFSTMAADVTDTEAAETEDELMDEVETADPEEEPEEEMLEETDETDETDDEENDIIEENDWSQRVMANVQDCVNIRKGPGTDTERIGLLYRGGAADILERGEEWTKVRSGEVEGYIYNKYLLFDDEARELAEELLETVAVVEVSALNVRSEAAEEADCLEVVNTDQTLTVLDMDEQAEELEDDWVAVDLGDNVIGYVHSDYVVVEEKLGEALAIEEAVEAESSAVEVSTSSSGYSSSELDLMAAIIQCEAGGESYEGKIAVGAVIMNRVRSGSFPNNISDVVYQSGQFSPVASGWLSSVLAQGARSDCYEAAQDALNGANPVGDRLYFHAGGGNGLTIGNQTFY